MNASEERNCLALKMDIKRFENCLKVDVVFNLSPLFPFLSQYDLRRKDFLPFFSLIYCPSIYFERSRLSNRIAAQSQRTIKCKDLFEHRTLSLRIIVRLASSQLRKALVIELCRLLPSCKSTFSLWVCYLDRGECNTLSTSGEMQAHQNCQVE